MSDAKVTLRKQLEEQANEKQRQVKQEKLAEVIADAEMNKVTSTTTILGSRLAAPYAELVQNVR